MVNAASPYDYSTLVLPCPISVTLLVVHNPLLTELATAVVCLRHAPPTSPDTRRASLGVVIVKGARRASRSDGYKWGGVAGEGSPFIGALDKRRDAERMLAWVRGDLTDRWMGRGVEHTSGCKVVEAVGC